MKKKYKATWSKNGEVLHLVATVRWNDECRNGHKTFAVTGDLYSSKCPSSQGGHTLVNGKRCGWVSGGCLHDEISKRIPELRPALKYHLCSEEGPLHYEANTIYLAGNWDHYGLVGGKERELDAARRTAIWPEATDAELSVEREELRTALRKRLPALLRDFYVVRKCLGFPD